MKFKFFIFLIMSLFSTSLTASQCNCGSRKGWEYLQNENREFIKNKQYAKERRKTAHHEHPAFVVLSCADSRIPPEIIFNQGLGKIYCPRVAGNTAEAQVIDSISYAVETWHVKTIVVMGHDDCGAVKAALEHLKQTGGIVGPEIGSDAVLFPIERAIVYGHVDIYGPNAVEESIKANVEFAAKQLIHRSHVISSAIKHGQLVIVGSIYNLKSGKARELFVYNNCE